MLIHALLMGLLHQREVSSPMVGLLLAALLSLPLKTTNGESAAHMTFVITRESDRTTALHVWSYGSSHNF